MIAGWVGGGQIRSVFGASPVCDDKVITWMRFLSDRAVFSKQDIQQGVVMRAVGDHQPVMLRECLEALALGPGQIAIDATVGLGGHSAQMISRLAPGGSLLAIDWDQLMLDQAKERLGSPVDVTIHWARADYREIPELLATAGHKAADAILIDMGVNSAQLDDPQRGVSFQHAAPLDMRLDRSKGETAASLLNRSTPAQIERILTDFGDERFARTIAKVIVDRRKTSPLRTTQDLIECVLEAIPPRARDKRIHPATRTFQSVRIAVNNELDNLEEAIENAAKCLVPGGRLVTLAYHSGEDRAVKHAFRKLSTEGFSETSRKPIVASEAEIAENPRARSAKMRVLVRDHEEHLS